MVEKNYDAIVVGSGPNGLAAAIVVNDLNELPQSKAILFDVSPRNLQKIAGDQFSKLYKCQLGRYKYGVGILMLVFRTLLRSLPARR
tara:strand:- start:65720 stop:65980 length:261 start_codon:yes stop_codon:yes gene_type:complete